MTMSKELWCPHFMDGDTELERGIWVNGWQALNQGLFDSKTLFLLFLGFFT